jgi:predicted nucleic acid-binding protein
LKWLLDTNVLSENVRPRPNRAVLTWIAERAPSEIAISIVTLAELQDGAATAPDEADRRKLTRWLDSMVVPFFADRVLHLTSETLVDWLRLTRRLEQKRVARKAPDLLIASTARVHNLIVVSRNVRDFADTGVIVYDPWTETTRRMDDP